MDLRNVVITKINEAYTVYSAKGRSEQMRNRKTYALTLCTEGQITYTQNENEYVSHRNTAIILPKGGNYLIRGDKTGSFPVINFECSGFLCDTIQVIAIQNTDQLLADFEEIKKHLCFADRHAYIFSIFYRMLHNLSSSKLPPLLENAIRLMENQYNVPDLTNAQLADACQVSEVYLRKLFAKHLNTSPKQYIIDLRLQKAKQMLSEGVLRIAEIADCCGFSNAYHFCRTFKEHTGITPSEYRKENIIYKI